MATVYEARCLGGDFQQRVIAFPVYGYCLKEAPDVHMWVRLAWCYNCQKVAHAERLLSQGEVEERVASSTNRNVRRDAEQYGKMLASRQFPPSPCPSASVRPVTAATLSRSASLIFSSLLIWLGWEQSIRLVR